MRNRLVIGSSATVSAIIWLLNANSAISSIETDAVLASNAVCQTTTVGTNYFIANVGIGTNLPSAKLHVVGNSRLDGAIEVTGSMTVPRQCDVSMGGYTNGAPTNGVGIYSVVTNIAPVGSVMAWLKNFTNTPSLPSGWVECNGQILTNTASPYHGVTLPNLNAANRFLRGSSSSGTTGGVDSVTLTTNQIPIHSHALGTSEPDAPQQWENGKYLLTGTAAGWVAPNWYDNATLTHTHTVANSGLGQSHENRPAYYGVVWIMRVQ